MARIHRRTVQKDLHDPDNHDGVTTNLEADILECEVKWALGSITMNKVSGGDRIPVQLFIILKDDVVKVLQLNMPANLETVQWPQFSLKVLITVFINRSVFISIPKKGNAKECLNYNTIALISCTSKVMLKILQVRLQQYVNH